MVGTRLNLACTKGEIKVKLEEAIKKWKEHDAKMKKKKEEDALDLQENKFNPEEEKDMKNKKRTLAYLKKNIARKSDFRYLTNNVGRRG